jgi:hypothetical protein
MYPMPTIVLYSKAGCSLCVEAREELERVRAEASLPPFSLEEIDIAGDPALMTAHGEFIPVVTLNGRVIFKYFVDATRLRELLREVTE